LPNVEIITRARSTSQAPPAFVRETTGETEQILVPSPRRPQDYQADYENGSSQEIIEIGHEKRVTFREEPLPVIDAPSVSEWTTTEVSGSVCGTAVPGEWESAVSPKW
jgi:hypothetical protein